MIWSSHTYCAVNKSDLNRTMAGYLDGLDTTGRRRTAWPSYVTVACWIMIVTYQLHVVVSDNIKEGLMDTPRPNWGHFSDYPLNRHLSKRSADTDDCQMTCQGVKDRPVCASNGQTYPSKCQLRRVRACQKIQLNIVSKGPCPGESKCYEERRRTLTDIASRKNKQDQYVPQCKSDGAFNEVQCHNATGYCWCVTTTGKPIPGSSVQGSTINCHNQSDKNALLNYKHRGFKRRRGLASKGCGLKERSTFNTNLVKLFNEEYVRAKKYSKGDSESYDSSAASVVQWKFVELDQNKDKQLKPNEIHNLRSMIIKLVKPHQCAVSFYTYCDRNNDNLIAQLEWSTCLGFGLGELIRNDLSKDSEVRTKVNYGAKPDKKRVSSGKNIPTHQKSRPIPVRKNKRKPTGVTGGHTSGNSDVSNGGGSSKMDASSTRPVSFLALISSKTSATSQSKSNAQTSGQQQKSFPNPSSGGARLPSTFGDHRSISDYTRIPEATVRNSCVEERERANELDKADPDGHIFIPECDPVTGLYNQAQCHNSTEYCWCVNDQTGLPIPGISTHNVTPDCTELKSKKLKGCPYLTKKRFLTELLDHITQQMVDRATTLNTTGVGTQLDEPNPDQSIEERAVRWKHRMIDSNKNDVLERNELKALKEEIIVVKGEEKFMRKCRRNFLQFCDDDNNSRVTMSEWVECMGLNDHTKNLPENPKRRGPNPFSTVLKS